MTRNTTTSEAFAGTLQLVEGYSQELLELQADLSVLEAQIKAKKERLETLATVKLPELLDELGFSDMRLSNGLRLEMATKIFASIPSEGAIAKIKKQDEQRAALIRRKAALAWLREHELGDLIKNELSCAFGRGDEDRAKTLEERLVKEGYPAGLEATVNTNTLTAQIRDLMEKGEDVPFETFGICVVRTVNIK